MICPKCGAYKTGCIYPNCQCVEQQAAYVNQRQREHRAAAFVFVLLLLVALWGVLFLVTLVKVLQ